MRKIWIGAGLLFGLFTNMAFGNNVEILDVEIKKSGPETYRISVTLLHDDTGWDHYANEWQVLTLNGVLLGSRILAHPHVNEQPFTRSLGQIKILKGTKKVKIRAKDSVHGWTKEFYIIDVPKK